MPLPAALLAIPALLSIGAKFAKTRKQTKHQERLEALAEQQSKRAAIGRALGMSDPFYQEVPKAPSTTTEDVLAGIGDIGGVVGSQYLAGIDPNLTALQKAKKGALKGVGNMPRYQPGVTIPDIYRS